MYSRNVEIKLVILWHKTKGKLLIRINKERHPISGCSEFEYPRYLMQIQFDGVLSKQEFKVFYKTYAKHYMEFCIQAWSPYLQKRLNCLERIQRRATKIDGPYGVLGRAIVT